MSDKFNDLVSKLQPLLDRLLQSTPTKSCLPPIDMPEQGIYLFSENGNNLYVGRSNRMRARFQQHTRQSSPHNHASFAFKIARKLTGNEKAVYVRNQGTAADLLKDMKFGKVFKDAKDRVRDMEYRYVEVNDQKLQTILEIYTAIALKCKYNDFGTH